MARRAAIALTVFSQVFILTHLTTRSSMTPTISPSTLFDPDVDAGPSRPARTPPKQLPDHPPNARSKSKSKPASEREQRERRGTATGTGKATISLRQDAVEQLVGDVDDDDEGGSHPSSKGQYPSDERPPPPSAFFRPRGRPRANSATLPLRFGPTVDKGFYLPHFSMDQEYSLKPGEKHRPLNLELAFDRRNGKLSSSSRDKGSLPREALRALTEATDVDLRRGRGGRKGSIAVGLFKESRKVVEKEKERRRKSQRDVMIEEEDELDLLPPGEIKRYDSPSKLKEDLVKPSAIPGDLRQRLGEVEPLVSSAESSEGEDDLGSDDELEVPDEDDEDDEEMRFRLKPFNHQAGGHSTLYSFTNRLVAKVRCDRPRRSTWLTSAPGRA